MDTGQFTIIVLTVLFLVFFTLKQLNRFKDVMRIFLSKSKYQDYDIFFKKYFNYYNLLSDKEKRRFIYRAYNLSNTLKIVGRQGFEISEKVKFFVVAAQVQLTFGFNNYYLNRFKTIFVYPDTYRNPVTGNLHDGEVNPRGLIVLSWKKLVKGHVVADDKINLGLHEFAHALMHTVLHSENHEAGLDYYLDKILKLSKDEIVKIKSSDHHFFRDYAGTNIFEFFAIAIEYFFEVPKDFRKELPLLYTYLVKLLRQDPAKRIFRV